MNNFFCRLYQKTLFVASFLLPWRSPKVLEGSGKVKEIPSLLLQHKKSKPLIVTDKAAIKRGALDQLFESLKQNGFLDFAVFDGVLPNPTITQIEQGREIFVSQGCDSIVAFGGGSVLDCAKIVGARVVKKNQPVSKMRGLFKINKKLPLFVAVPTTAGTGSEVTVAAVVTDSESHQKFAINDFSLVPHFAVLDASTTLDLPPNLSATTGMDALTHAIEAYIGKSNTSKTKQKAEQAVKLIFDNIEKVHQDGKDIVARQNMQRAAFLAGEAFTRAYVGYVHAIAHALGGKCGIPHGLCNAIVLPVVLFAYGKSAEKPLSRLADIVGISGQDTSEKAKNFIFAILDLNEKLGIPSSLPAGFAVKNSDISDLVTHACREANPLYPVPMIFFEEDIRAILTEIM